MDPLKVEQAYSRLTTEIQRAGSERVQLFLIYEFIESLQGDYQTFDSYLIQLFDLFPALNHPLLFTGLHPAKLEDIILSLEEAIEAIPEIRSDEVERKINLLKTGLHHIYDWLGISHVNKENRLPSHSGLSKKSKEKEKTYGEVFIPVVESSGAMEAKGRLRKLRVDVVGKSKAEEFELRPVFGVIGANTGNLGMKPAKAAGALLTESVNTRNYWSGTASFELSHTWHAGNSANLALGGLFYCEMLKVENRREYFQINPGVAITGDVDESGKVLSVDEETLKQKAEAAFFSWAQVLVVPVQHLEIALELMDELREEYPNRELIVKGVGHLRELFYDRRLTLHKQRSIVAHTAKKVWKKRNSAVAVLIFLIMLGVIGRLIYGPLDRNPVTVGLAGNFLVLKNYNGIEISKVEVGKSTVDYFNSINSFTNNYVLYDITGDGVNELIWGNYTHYSKRQRSFVQAWSVSGDTVIWETEMNFNNRFSALNMDLSGGVQIREIALVNASPQEKKLVVLGGLNYFFPNKLSTVNLQTGETEQDYIHTGILDDMAVFDLDNDGTDEIIATGVNNAFWLASLVVLDPNKVNGHSPITNQYAIENTPKAKEKYYLLIPKSPVGQVMSYVKKFNRGKRILIDRTGDQFWVEVSEAYRKIAGVQDYARILLYFDFQIRPAGVGTSDLYDIMVKEFYEEGRLSEIPGQDYFKAYMDSLLYWNGETFQHEPTMNKAYLRATGKLEE